MAMATMAEEIVYRPYVGESDLPNIMALVQSELSEPYVIYTYRYFLQQWSVAPSSHLCRRSPLTAKNHRNKSNASVMYMHSINAE